MSMSERIVFALLALATATCNEGSSDVADGGSSSGGAQSVEGLPPRIGAQITGTVANDWFGYGVASRSDIDGDGQSDLVVQSHASGAGGRIAVFLGPLDADLEAGAADIVIEGESGFSNLGEGFVWSGGCDVDADGDDDSILGGPFADTTDVAESPIRSGDNAGKAYLVLGGPDLVGTLSATQADTQFLGEAAYDTAGSATACLGDLDGDGFDDFAIAAKGNARGGEDSGAVYLFYGRSSFPAIVELGEADAILHGSTPYEQAGYAVAPAGDATGDGRPDVLVGAPNSDAFGASAGLAYLVAGSEGRFTGEIDLADTVRINGDTPGLRLGWSLSGGADVNGDGIDDLVVGASVAPTHDVAARAFVVLGGSDLTGTVELATRGIAIEHPEPDVGHAVSVAIVDDVSGNGLADVVVGALQASGEVPGTGAITLFEGRSTWPDRLQVDPASAWTLTGSQSAEFFGEVVAPIGDIDGDGAADLAVTAKSHAAGASSRSGAVRLILGQAPVTSE